MLELLSAERFWVLSMDAFNDRLLLFLLSFMSFSLLTLLLMLVLSFVGEEVLIVLVSIIACRDGIDILRIFNSCFRSKMTNLIGLIDLIASEAR